MLPPPARFPHKQWWQLLSWQHYCAPPHPRLFTSPLFTTLYSPPPLWARPHPSHTHSNTPSARLPQCSSLSVSRVLVRRKVVRCSLWWRGVCKDEEEEEKREKRQREGGLRRSETWWSQPVWRSTMSEDNHSHYRLDPSDRLNGLGQRRKKPKKVEE